MKSVVLVLLAIITGYMCEAQSIDVEFPQHFEVSIENKLPRGRHDVVIYIEEAGLLKKYPAFNPNAFAVFYRDVEVPSQYNGNDFSNRSIVVVLDSMQAKEKSTLTVRFNSNRSVSVRHTYSKRTHAELSHKTGGKFINREYIGGNFTGVKALRVPPEHKDHSWFIRYEGPGWESDKVGYRFYLDQRNATDVFGKKTSQIVLPEVGLDGFDSYHDMQPWGMDILKVGPSLGLGSPGYLEGGKAIRVEKTDSVKCEITEDGNVYSSIRTDYSGWKLPTGKINLTSVISITAGSRMSKQLLITDKRVDGLCTGIIKDKAAVLVSDEGTSGRFAYLMTYGKQSLNKDELGLAILVRHSDLKKFGSDEQNHIVELSGKNSKVEYYFLAAWIGEPGGISDKNTFQEYVVRIAEELANPVRVKLL
jgi:hypothetical protein